MTPEHKISEKSNTQEPFVIRAHHLRNLSGIKVEHYDDGNSKPYADSSREVNGIISAIKSSSIEGYPEDVLGTSLESFNGFAQQLEEFLRKFLTLPNDYPVEIAEGTRDDICRGCATGMHCEEDPYEEKLLENKNPLGIIRRYYRYRNYPHLDDSLVLDVFIEIAKNSKTFPVRPEYSIINENVYYSESKKAKKARRLRTTMGVARDVVSQFPTYFSYDKQFHLK